MYDFAHGQSDYFEGVTHSICTLEFVPHRPLYDKFIDFLKESDGTDDNLSDNRPRQIEFNRLNLTYTVMSKRKLHTLVDEHHVKGWDDPRMPTLCGMRRRGYSPESIRNFIDSIGYTKFDAKYSYKQDFGYFPGWASIGGIIVGGENRDGNTNVRFHQEDTLRRIMDRVTSELGVVIERFRADCGSFSKEIIQTVEQRCNTFYIRAANCGSRCEDFRQLKEWKSVEVGYERCDVTSVNMDNLIEGKPKE